MTSQLLKVRKKKVEVEARVFMMRMNLYFLYTYIGYCVFMMFIRTG